MWTKVRGLTRVNKVIEELLNNLDERDEIEISVQRDLLQPEYWNIQCSLNKIAGDK
jgi:hypothetical protein